MKQNKNLDHESAMRELGFLISYIKDPYLQQRFNAWVNDNLHKVEARYFSTEQSEKYAPEGFAEHYAKEVLQRKLLDEASTVATVTKDQYAGYPNSTVRTLSMMFVGKK